MWPKGNAESPSDDSNTSNENEPALDWKERLQTLRGDMRARIRNCVTSTNERLEQLETKLDPARQSMRLRYQEASDSYMRVRESSAYVLDAYRRKDEASALLAIGIAGLAGSAFLVYRRRWTPASTVAVASGGCLYASVYGLDFK